MADAAALFVPLAEAAEKVGFGANENGRKRLLRRIQARQKEAGRHILQGDGGKGSPYFVNLDELRGLCPELFPVANDQGLAELRAFLTSNNARMAEIEAEIGDVAEGSFALYGEMMDLVRELQTKVAYLEGQMRTREDTSAAKGGESFFLSGELENQKLETDQ